jgi:hypothetical protein
MLSLIAHFNFYLSEAKQSDCSKLDSTVCMYYILVMSTIPKLKYKRSDIEANYRNKTKTF